VLKEGSKTRRTRRLRRASQLKAQSDWDEDDLAALFLSYHQMSFSLPPAYSSTTTPPAGLRVPASTFSGFPSVDLTGPPPLRDLDGSAVFVASALVGTKSVHPCKVVNDGRVMLSYGGVCWDMAWRCWCVFAARS
jgi:hypothetical protein